MISAMESNVEELIEKNLVLSKKATEAEEMKHGYKFMKERETGLFHKVYYNCNNKPCKFLLQCNLIVQCMEAESQMSEVLLALQDKHSEAIALSQKLDAVEATNKALKAHVKDLENENCALEKVACDLLDKVNSIYYSTSARSKIEISM